MRVAVILESELHAGGGFQQELSTACLLARQQGAHDFVFYATNQQTVRVLKEKHVLVSFLAMRSLSNRFRGLARRMGVKDVSIAPFERILLRDRIDLVYFLAPSGIASHLRRLNYVITVWDQCHRDHPEFPEVNFDGQFERREDVYMVTLPKAVAVLVDAPLSKENLVRRYGCDAQRVHVASFLPSIDIKNSSEVDIKKKYGVTGKYIFYPAQFWAHKNHVYILDGLKILRGQHGLGIEAVFTGSDKKNLQFVLSYAQKLGLKDAVHYVGFVPNEDMASFYRQAIALVMPTYFGPTNIPPLEAFALGCPVCYSDLPGLRDQVGDAAFLMDLKDPGSLARHVVTILNDRDIVRQKISKGKTIAAGWTEDDYWNVLKGIFDEYAVKQHCWKDQADRSGA